MFVCLFVRSCVCPFLRLSVRMFCVRVSLCVACVLVFVVFAFSYCWCVCVFVCLFACFLLVCFVVCVCWFACLSMCLRLVSAKRRRSKQGQREQGRARNERTENRGQAIVCRQARRVSRQAGTKERREAKGNRDVYATNHIFVLAPFTQ